MIAPLTGSDMPSALGLVILETIFFNMSRMGAATDVKIQRLAAHKLIWARRASKTLVPEMKQCFALGSISVYIRGVIKKTRKKR